MSRALLIALLLAAAPARAQAPAKPPPARVRPVSARIAGEMADLRQDLRRREIIASIHAEKIARGKLARARLTVKLLGEAMAVRGRLMARLDQLLGDGPERFDGKARPLALELMGNLVMDQEESREMLRAAAEPLPEGERPKQPEAGAASGAELAIQMWQRLVDEFPRHQRTTAVLGDLAEAYFDAGRYEEAKLALQRLLCGNRESEITRAGEAVHKADDDLTARVYAQQARIADYRACVPRLRDREIVDDAWLRLAWLHRGSSGELAQAISAYERVAADPRSPAYVDALNEMAAAYHEGDREIDAIPVLDALVEHLDRQLHEEKVDEPSWPELRVDAIERLGRIVAELWRASAVPEPTAARDLALIYFRGRTHQRHVRDVFIAAGASLRSFGAFDQALPMWAEVLSAWPDHPGAPQVHARMVALLVEKGDSRAADAERRRFLDGFGPGSRWRRSNQRNRRALAAADRLGEELLFTLAGNRYRQMAIAAERGDGDAATLAGDAAALNERFLAEHPRSKLAYEAGFRFAHSLLVAGRREQAVQRLRWVRDQDRRGAHFGEATRHVVVALEQARDRAVAAGKLVEPPLPDRKALESATEQALPPLIADLQRAYDDLAAALRGSPAAAAPRMQAALIDLRWGRIEAAEDRLGKLLADHCQTPAAREASEHLARISEARQRGGLAGAAQNLFQRACGDSKAMAAVRNLRITAAVKEAQELGRADRWEDAGRRYWAAHRESPPDHGQHDDALFLAADAFRRARRLDAARSLAWSFVSREDLRGSEYYPEALQLAGWLASRTFAYDAAVDALLRLVDLADRKGTPVRSGFDLGAAATEALALAAELREIDRIYYDRGPDDPGAVTLYLRYAVRPGLTVEQSSRGYLRGAAILHRAGDAAALVKLVDDFESRPGKQAAAAPFRVELLDHLARTHEEGGDLRAAGRAYVRVIEAFDASGRKPGSKEAALAAAAQFWVAEDAYAKQLLPHAFRWPDDGNEKEATTRIEALGRAGERAEKEFKAVLRFDTTWSIAARARIGDVYAVVADKLIEAPPPRALGAVGGQIGAESLDAFVDQLRKVIQPVYDEAIKSWKEALAEADRRDDRGRWTRHTREQLNRFDPARYPVLREELIIKEDHP